MENEYLLEVLEIEIGFESEFDFATAAHALARILDAHNAKIETRNKVRNELKLISSELAKSQAKHSFYDDR